jgi:malonate-semialdehyde dehydrogenase (acetylating) / methylmalonate-semialdehyde dehydrogenase
MATAETLTTTQVSHWIDGKPSAATSGRSGPVMNPATGEQIAEVGFAAVADVDRAVASAKAAAHEWRFTALSRRAEIMFRFRELIVEHKQQLAEIISRENGKTMSDALGEVARGLENVEFACGIPHLLKGGYTEQASRGVDVYQIRQPLGVVAGITPFNFPGMVPLWMLSNAITCGNSFVLKPSEKVPGASVYLAGLLKEAGLPDGVLNLVHGDKVAVDRILEHPDIKAVSFVGSTPVAKYIYETATRNGKRVQALGGAKNHMLVLPDADINMAADAAVSAGYGAAGERCMAISVVLAVGKVADPLIDAIRERMAKIKVGPGSDPTSEMGPLITCEHRDRVAAHLDKAAAEGATITVDGRKLPAPNKDGFFLGPSLIDNAKPGMACYDTEIFGPVLSVVRVDTYAEALKLINENPYGNGTAIFTQNGGAARQFQFDAEVGMVGINVPIPVPVAYYSFGGWKSSLFGDLHMYGPEGVQFYTRGKVVTSRWPDPSASKVDLGFPQVR